MGDELVRFPKGVRFETAELLPDGKAVAVARDGGVEIWGLS